MFRLVMTSEIFVGCACIVTPGYHAMNRFYVRHHVLSVVENVVSTYKAREVGSPPTSVHIISLATCGIEDMWNVRWGVDMAVEGLLRRSVK
jgi:hypothetical protein